VSLLGVSSLYSVNPQKSGQPIIGNDAFLVIVGQNKYHFSVTDHESALDTGIGPKALLDKFMINLEMNSAEIDRFYKLNAISPIKAYRFIQSKMTKEQFLSAQHLITVGSKQARLNFETAHGDLLKQLSQLNASRADMKAGIGSAYFYSGSPKTLIISKEGSLEDNKLF
jgi:hypothetical protein